MDPLDHEGSPEVLAGEGDPARRKLNRTERDDWLKCVRATLQLLDRRWLPAILLELDAEPCRFGELLDRIDGVSNKVLADTLNQMDAGGLIAQVRIRDEWGARASLYVLTDAGRSTFAVFDPVRAWGTAHLEAIQVGEHAAEVRSAAVTSTSPRSR